jgi:hypothetical protein
MLTTNYCNRVQVHWAAEVACYNTFVVDIVAHHRSNLNTWSQHPKYLILGNSHLMHKHPKYFISSHLISWKKMIKWNSRLLYKTYHTSHLGCEQCLELCSHDPEVSSQSRRQRSLLLQSHKPSCLPFFFGSLVNLLSFVSFVVCLMSLVFFAA